MSLPNRLQQIDLILNASKKKSSLTAEQKELLKELSLIKKHKLLDEFSDFPKAHIVIGGPIGNCPTCGRKL